MLNKGKGINITKNMKNANKNVDFNDFCCGYIYYVAQEKISIFGSNDSVFVFFAIKEIKKIKNKVLLVICF